MLLTVQACISPFYLSLNSLVNPGLVLAPGITNSSTALSWPHGTEFSDSYLKLTAFYGLSFKLTYDDPYFFHFFEDVPFAMLQRLVGVDYRKSLIAHRMSLELRDLSNSFHFVFATAQTLSHTVFECIRTEYFDKLVPAAFLLVWFEYDYPKLIDPHAARLSINWRKQRSSGHMFLSLDRVVSQHFCTISSAKSR